MAGSGDHRRVPAANLLIAATTERAGVPLVHYDPDYERITAVTRQPHLWFVAHGALAENR
jgi:predicted nucleic acid-binding protein